MHSRKTILTASAVAVFAVFLAISSLLGWDATWMPFEPSITLEEIPAYSGEPYVVLYDNQPLFTDEEMTTQSFEDYAPLDALGRCTVTSACLGQDLMPTEERGSIGSVKPSGWVTAKYDHVDGKYLYNRCHLIGFQLAGENANERNLITGTRYMNVDGMLPFENMVADYIHETQNHVMYRITPWFYENELLARGVQIEAYSVEDNGEGICFNVFCHNVQPGVQLNYQNGNSAPEAANTTAAITTTTATAVATTTQPTTTVALSSFVLNTNTKKIHRPGCRSINSMKESNKKNYRGTVEELQSMGYTTCGNCF